MDNDTVDINNGESVNHIVTGMMMMMMTFSYVPGCLGG